MYTFSSQNGEKMSLGIDPNVYDPTARLKNDQCSIYEFLGVGCVSLLVMPTETTNQKIGCIVGCTVVGTSLGAIGGTFIGGIGMGPGAGYGAAVGCAIGVIKVAVDSCRRNCH